VHRAVPGVEQVLPHLRGARAQDAATAAHPARPHAPGHRVQTRAGTLPK